MDYDSMSDLVATSTDEEYIIVVASPALQQATLHAADEKDFQTVVMAMTQAAGTAGKHIYLTPCWCIWIDVRKKMIMP